MPFLDNVTFNIGASILFITKTSSDTPRIFSGSLLALLGYLMLLLLYVPQGMPLTNYAWLESTTSRTRPMTECIYSVNDTGNLKGERERERETKGRKTREKYNGFWGDCTKFSAL